MQASDALLAQLSDVRKRYGTVPALDGVDLDLRAGEVLALLGANGAGKTTAIGLLLGLLAADSGTATLFGQPPRSLAARRRIGVMLQSASIPEASKVGELLELTRSYYPDPRSVADCVALAGLDGLLDRRYGRLSGGQQRRVQLAHVRRAVSGIRAAGLAAELASAKLLLECDGVVFRYARADVPLTPELETVFALTLREAVTNVQRHARATPRSRSKPARARRCC